MPDTPRNASGAAALQRLLEMRARPNPAPMTPAEEEGMAAVALAEGMPPDHRSLTNAEAAFYEASDRVRPTWDGVVDSAPRLGGFGAGAPIADAAQVLAGSVPGPMSTPEGEPNQSLPLQGPPNVLDAVVQPQTSPPARDFSRHSRQAAEEAPREQLEEARRREPAVLTDRTVGVGDAEMSLAPLDPGSPDSALQAEDETTQFESQANPDGSLTFTVPGVEGQLHLPPGLSPAQFEDATAAAAANFTRGIPENLSGPPNTWSISPTRRQQMFDVWRSHAATTGAGRPQGPAGPLTRVDTRFQQTIDGPVSPLNQARMARANAAVTQAQQIADQADQGMVQTREEQARRQSEFLQQQAEEQARIQAEQQAMLMSRMQQFDDALQRVASGRIDPNRYFGKGAGGRIGAAIAVALGEIGRAFTGGPNAALGIINAAIDRDMRAQEMDMQNARQSAALQGQALGQMQSIFRDQNAAKAAARATYYQAFLAQVDSAMANASGDRLAAYQQLRSALQEQLQAAQAVASDKERGRIQASWQTTQRTRNPRASAIQAGQRAQAGIREAQQNQFDRTLVPGIEAGIDEAREMMRSEDPQQRQEGLRRMRQLIEQIPESVGPEDHPQGADLRRQADAEANVRGQIERLQPGEEGGIRLSDDPEAVRLASPSVQDAVRSARQRLRRNPNDRGARETVSAYNRRVRQNVRATERRARRMVAPWTSEQSEEASDVAERLRESANQSSPPSTPIPGMTWLEDIQDPQARARYAHMWETAPDDRKSALLRSHSGFRALANAYPQIIGAVREYGFEATNNERRMAIARALRANLLELRQSEVTGAAVSEEQARRFAELMPEPGTMSSSAWMRSFINAWNGELNARANELNSLANSFGLRIDNRSSNFRIGNDVLRQLQGN